jgi:protein ImuA
MEDLGVWLLRQRRPDGTRTLGAVPEVALTLASTLVRTKQERELRCVALRNDVPGGAEGLLVPPAGVERAGGATGRVLIEQLRVSIRALEQVPVSLAIPPAPGTAPPHPACSLFSSSKLSSPGLTGRSSSPWPHLKALPQPINKGQGLLDARLRGRDRETRKFPLSKLRQGGVHEIKAASYRDYPAALALALAAVAEAAAKAKRRSLVLWCLTKEAMREWGRPYGPGLCALGLDPSRILIAEARTAQDVAWALEEGLKSRALIAALAQIEIKAPLVTRRLGLAAQASSTPCLLLSSHQQSALPGTLTRWRIAAKRSGPAPYDANAPGPASWQFTLERYRGEAGGRSFIVEFSHESLRVRLPAASSDRAAEAGESRERRGAASR